MFCSRCGKNLGEESACNQCGSLVAEMGIPGHSSEPPLTGDGFATASLVCGVISWATLGGFFVVPLIGIILGRLGLNSRQSEVAVAGIIINVAVIVMIIMFFLFWALLIWSAGPASGPLSSGGRCC